MSRNLFKAFFASCLLSIVWVGLGGQAVAQQQAPPLLVHAAACLTAKKHLPLTAAAALSFGYRIDTTTYPGKKVLYVVAAPGTHRSAGRAFAIFFTEKPHRQKLDIQNGATFVRSEDGKGTISFIEAPFGGAEPYTSFVSAIQQIEGQPWFTIPAADLAAPLGRIQCTSYSDEQ